MTKKAEKAKAAEQDKKVKDYKAGKVKVPPPTTTDEAKKIEGAVARESEKAKKAEQDKKVKEYEAGKLKVPPPTSSDQAKRLGGVVAEESEKGAAPVAPAKQEKK